MDCMKENASCTKSLCLQLKLCLLHFGNLIHNKITVSSWNFACSILEILSIIIAGLQRDASNKRSRNHERILEEWGSPKSHLASFICNETMNINGIVKFYNVVGMLIIAYNPREWDIKPSPFVLIYTILT